MDAFATAEVHPRHSRADLWRCFVAVPIGDELRAAIAKYVAELRREPWAEDWRWTDPANWHITLAFLGSIPPSTVPAINRTLDLVAGRRAPFTVQTGGLGRFPSERRPRVLWYGIDDASSRLLALAGDVRASLVPEDASPFRPHLTLARARRARDPLPSRPAASLPTPPLSRLDVVEIGLYRSVPGTPRYQPLSSVKLTSDTSQP